MKVLFLMSLLMSVQAFASTESVCRVAIKNLDKLLGNNSVLIDEVHRKLEKKNISIISDQEVMEGDFLINDLIAVHKGIITNPLHSYNFETKSKIRMVPCVALPLCSPVMVEKEVSSITGLNYDHQYSIQVMKSSNLKKVKYESFRHKFKEEPRAFLNGSFDGSPEQVDLALALVKEIPKCSSLVKAGSR